MCEHTSYKIYDLELLSLGGCCQNGTCDHCKLQDESNLRMMEGFVAVCNNCQYVSYPCSVCKSIKQIILIPSNISMREVFEDMPEIKNADSDSDYDKYTFNEECDEPTPNLDLLIKKCLDLNWMKFFDISCINLRWFHYNTRITGHDGGAYFIMKCDECKAYTSNTDK